MQNAMKIMPVIFGFISWNFVTGLGLYFATSNIFRVGQQAFILRSHGNDETTEDGPESAIPDGPSDEPTSDGPSPNASKKRNRKRRK